MRMTIRFACTSMLLALAACGNAAEAPETTPSPTSTPPPAPVSAARAGPDTMVAPPGNANGKLELTGTFEIAGTQWGEAWTALHFDEVALSMENERVIRVNGRGTPAIDSAIDAIASINIETDSPEGKRAIEACSDGCSLEATIVEESRGEWYVTALRSVTPATAPQPLNVGTADPRRKTLLDVLRPAIEKDLGQPVQFAVDVLRERDGSAFAVVHPRTAQGKPVDFSKTKYAQRLEDGVLDGDTIYAMLQHRDGAWMVREFVVGPTDVAWANWAQAYGAPEAIFLDGPE